jgi:beta-galactosidase
MLPENDSNRVVRVEFDGVMANSDVWINGFHLGHRPNGYVSFSYELTGHLNLGGDNVLAVRADTSAQPASRWYSGAGIYRHVRLRVTDRFTSRKTACLSARRKFRPRKPRCGWKSH